MASKRKVTFAEEDVDEQEIEKAFKEASAEVKRQIGVVDSEKRRFKEKHSLDSDEDDDDEDKYNVLNDDNIEGQEDGDVNYEEGVQFTPFNMKEELEEGHFDQDGMYIPKKEKVVHDNWLDNIDWVQIKERNSVNKEKYGSDYEDSDDEKLEQHKSAVDPIEVYRQMVVLMIAGETVMQAIRRLGGGAKSQSASQRWKNKRKKVEETSKNENTDKGNKEEMLKLTGLADEMLSVGNLEIYQDTYEKLKFKIQVADAEKEKAKVSIPAGTSADDALDMFADNLDTKQGSGDKKHSSESNAGKEIQWEYKWEEGEELHGPFSSEEMKDWQEDGFFKTGVLCRRVGTQQFYDSKRLDFELYT